MALMGGRGVECTSRCLAFDKPVLYIAQQDNLGNVMNGGFFWPGSVSEISISFVTGRDL